MDQDKSDIFVDVIETHKGIIYKIGHLYCDDHESRKDLIQEVLLQLWRSFDKYDARFKYSTWIYRVSLNVAISFYRKEKSRTRISNSFSEDIFNVADAGKNPDDKEDIRLLRNFLHDLKELDKALMLLYLEGESQREIAGIMGITETNVATKIARIKASLRSRFLNLSK